MENLKKISRTMPVCFLFAVVSTWLNGWATARRMKLKRPCVFCKTELSQDSIDHYACCPIVKTAADGIFRNRLVGNLRSFLIMERSTCSRTCDQAALLYCVRKASAIRRHVPLVQSKTEQDIRVIQNCHKMLLMNSQKCSRLYSSTTQSSHVVRADSGAVREQRQLPKEATR